jgi:hypothetical protein
VTPSTRRLRISAPDNPPQRVLKRETVRDHCPTQLRARFCVPPARRDMKPSPLPRCVMLRFTRSTDRDDGMNISPGARFDARLQNFLENVVGII